MNIAGVVLLVFLVGLNNQNIVIMKYIVLKNSLSFLCVQLPEGFGAKLEIVCLESQTEFDEYLKENPTKGCQISFAQPVSENGESPNVSLSRQDGFFVRHNDYYKKVLFSDIMWVEAARSYCCIQTTGKASLIVTYPLAEVRKKLPSELFIQTHRSFLVNVKLVEKFIGNMLYVGKKSIPISRKFKKEVLERFFFLDNIKEALGKYVLPPEKESSLLENNPPTDNENDKNLETERL